MSPHADDIKKILDASSVVPCPTLLDRYNVTLGRDIAPGVTLHLILPVDVPSDIDNGDLDEALATGAKSRLLSLGPVLGTDFDITTLEYLDEELDWDCCNQKEVDAWMDQFGDTHDPATGAYLGDDEEDDFDDDDFDSDEDDEDDEDADEYDYDIDDLYESDTDDEDEDAMTRQWRERFGL